MGSQSDYKTMQLAEKTLKKIGISYETKIISAHRTPKRMYEYAAAAKTNNIGVIIAGAGGSAHLPGMISAITSLPVLGVPIESKKLKGLDSLLSIAQMPKGIPVGTLAIGEDGAINAALLAASIIANNNPTIKKNLNKLTIKVFGWKENFKKILSEIFIALDNYELEIVKITFSSDGFLTIEEKDLRTIFLGFKPNLINYQLQIINNIKKEFKENYFPKEIDNIDLTNPNKPKIKVFKP